MRTPTPVADRRDVATTAAKRNLNQAIPRRASFAIRTLEALPALLAAISDPLASAALRETGVARTGVAASSAPRLVDGDVIPSRTKMRRSLSSPRETRFCAADSVM